MRLIADGGSTKVHWVLYDGERHSIDLFTPGMNPATMSAETLLSILRKHLVPQLQHPQLIGKVEYYGAGCRGEACSAMRCAIVNALPHATDITVESDMLGACRAMSEGESAIVCILGTGANSCLYDGEKIIDNVPPLGYLLGDEGSGAWLGKTLVADILKKMLPEDLTNEFHRLYPYGYDELIRRIYRPTADDIAPNRFLASFAPFLSAHISHTYIKEIVTRGFNLFFDRNIMLYYNRYPLLSPQLLPLKFTGSIAAYFSEQLRDVAKDRNLPEPYIRRAPLGKPL